MMIHDVANNLTPPNIFNLFTHQADIHPYERRSSQRGDFSQELALKFGIACEFRQMSKSNFKNNVNDILFQRLLKYDDYIDVSMI